MTKLNNNNNSNSKGETTQSIFVNKGCGAHGANTNYSLAIFFAHFFYIMSMFCNV